MFFLVAVALRLLSIARTLRAQVPEGPARGASAGGACEYFGTPLGIIFKQSKSVAAVDRLDVLVVPGTILSV